MLLQGLQGVPGVDGVPGVNGTPGEQGNRVSMMGQIYGLAGDDIICYFRVPKE